MWADWARFRFAVTAAYSLGNVSERRQIWAEVDLLLGIRGESCLGRRDQRERWHSIQDPEDRDGQGNPELRDKYILVIKQKRRNVETVDGRRGFETVEPETLGCVIRDREDRKLEIAQTGPVPTEDRTISIGEWVSEVSYCEAKACLPEFEVGCD